MLDIAIIITTLLLSDMDTKVPTSFANYRRAVHFKKGCCYKHLDL